MSNESRRDTSRRFGYIAEMIRNPDLPYTSCLPHPARASLVQSLCQMSIVKRCATGNFSCAFIVHRATAASKTSSLPFRHADEGNDELPKGKTSAVCT